MPGKSSAGGSAEVWYESPFGEPQWMERSQAEHMLQTDLALVNQSDALLPRPRIVERGDRVRELAAHYRIETPEAFIDDFRSTGARR